MIVISRAEGDNLADLVTLLRAMASDESPDDPLAANRVDELARELGLHGVRLLVRPDNEPARSLYRHAGFEENGTIFCQKDSAEI